jgi:hypothetical protein
VGRIKGLITGIHKTMATLSALKDQGVLSQETFEAQLAPLQLELNALEAELQLTSETLKNVDEAENLAASDQEQDADQPTPPPHQLP